MLDGLELFCVVARVLEIHTPLTCLCIPQARASAQAISCPKVLHLVESRQDASSRLARDHALCCLISCCRKVAPCEVARAHPRFTSFLKTYSVSEGLNGGRGRLFTVGSFFRVKVTREEVDWLSWGRSLASARREGEQTAVCLAHSSF